MDQEHTVLEMRYYNHPDRPGVIVKTVFLRTSWGMPAIEISYPDANQASGEYRLWESNLYLVRNWFPWIAEDVARDPVEGWGFPTPRKEHSFDLGYIGERRSPYGARKIVIYKAEPAGIDVGTDKYAIVCDEHGQIGGATSVPKARSMMKDPTIFCTECRRIAEGD